MLKSASENMDTVERSTWRVTEENQVATELRSDGVPTKKTFFFSYSLPVVELLTWPRTKTKKVFLLREYSYTPLLRGNLVFLRDPPCTPFHRVHVFRC
jgi:hypothetical protein